MNINVTLYPTLSLHFYPYAWSDYTVTWTLNTDLVPSVILLLQIPLRSWKSAGCSRGIYGRGTMDSYGIQVGFTLFYKPSEVIEI